MSKRLIIIPSQEKQTLNYRTEDNSDSGQIAYSKEWALFSESKKVLISFLKRGYPVQISFEEGKRIPDKIKTQISDLEQEVLSGGKNENP